MTVADPDPGDRSLAGTVVSPTAGSVCPSGNPAPSCSVAVPVLVPALAVTDVAAVSSTTPGSKVAHTVSIANTGQTAYTQTSVAVALAGALDDASYDGDATASAGSLIIVPGSGQVVWTGDIPVGATVTAYGHRHLDPNRLEMKTERLVVTGRAFDIYPDRS